MSADRPAFFHDAIWHSQLSTPRTPPLMITQKPSRVHPLSSYKSSAISSLVVAFEDPDGSKLKTLLAERYLFAFGNRAKVRKRKQRVPRNKDKSSIPAAEHNQGSDSNDDEGVDAVLHQPPPSPTAAAPPPWQPQHAWPRTRPQIKTRPFPGRATQKAQDREGVTP